MTMKKDCRNKEYVELIGLRWCVENLRDAGGNEYFDYDAALNEAERQGLRLPTKEEFEALHEECVWEWDDEKKGCWVSDREYPERRIFLPAVGLRNRNYDGLYNSGTNGFCWSSTASADTTPAYAFGLNFYASGANPSNEYRRSYGFSVRCIMPKNLRP